jgi:SAM-dependent methyltransferase
MLELGCSDGRTSVELARAGATVVGIDISDVAIAKAREHARAAGVDSAEFEIGDASSLDYADGSFDVVFGSSIVHHLDVGKVASEALRVVKADGCAIFLEPLGHNPLIRLYRALTPAARTPDERPLLSSDLELLCSGWAATEISYYDFFTLGTVPFRRLPGAARCTALARRADDTVFRTPLAQRLAWFALLRLRHPVAAS